MAKATATTATATVSRRNILAGAFGAAATAAAIGAIQSPAKAADTAATGTKSEGARTMGSTIITRDGVEIYYKDWGPKDGPVVVLAHGWPLSSDSWEAQAFHLASNGFRVITHELRGHGRSSQPWDGNDMDHYADDLADVIEQLDLNDIFLVGFSTGGGEITRYIGRHGTGRVRKLGLISAVPPLMVKTDKNPGGLPKEVFDGLQAASLKDRSQLYRDIASGPFFGFNRPGATPSQGMIDSFWLQGMTGGHKNTYDSIVAFSQTDFTEDLKKFDVPTIIIHGEDDQIVPIDAAGRASKKLVPQAILKVYPGAPHGLTDTHKDQLNADLLEFARS
ncbi:alpha/beta hydrolase [Rhizobium sp. TRM96647]|uniref:alpha/beta fold hydrolase n=1 Tax=unclassified Rhizobium TaxID=2613769 RepID=UPI0021E827C7|nr:MULTISPECIES: alpha/beta hydrolase [unclassified Rhizobium]MCV3736707.1 alpha/beta hydrolase [Rhizobium sp. TRM96647]MCV3756893.1 alpha/beta hydrolase [Rhizobium sp. TRM96650]